MADRTSSREHFITARNFQHGIVSYHPHTGRPRKESDTIPDRFLNQEQEPYSMDSSDTEILVMTYGSGINPPTEISDHAGGIPVRVEGYRRHIQLPASYRAVLDEIDQPHRHMGVLDINKTDNTDDIINGVLYEAGPEEKAAMDDREAQYSIEKVPSGAIGTYSDENSDTEHIRSADRIIIYNSDNERDTSLHPHPRYLAEVLAGAHHWDLRLDREEPRFALDLLRTTEVSPGKSLEAYLRDPQNQQRVLNYIEHPLDVDDIMSLLTLDHPIRAEEDPWKAFRKWRNSVHDRDPATDAELRQEIKEMDPTTRQEVLDEFVPEAEHEDI